MDHLWNEDGTPKRPDPTQYGDPEKYAQTPFADLAADQEYLNFARIKREAREQRSPEVGDIVHWFDEKGVCRAAIVTETDSFSDTAELRVHIPREPYADARADHDEGKSDNTWHWPCGEGQ